MRAHEAIAADSTPLLGRGASKRATTYSEGMPNLGEGASARSSWTRATKLALGTAAVAGIVGTAFAARGAFVSRPSLGAQQRADIATLPEGFQTALLGYKFGPGEIGHQIFMTDNLVPQGGCDLELCGFHEDREGIFTFVDNCLGGGSGCAGLTSGCRQCTVNPDQVGKPAEWLPACPRCICEEYKLDPSLCSSKPSPVAPPSPGAQSQPSPGSQSQPSPAAQSQPSPAAQAQSPPPQPSPPPPDAPPPPPPPAVLQSFRTVEIPGINDGIEDYKTWKFPDAVFGPDGTTLYFVPYADYVGKYDTSSDTLTKISSDVLNTKQNFAHGVLVGSKIYMAPMMRNEVGVYDTAADTMTSISVASDSTPKNMFASIAAIGSKVYMCPNQVSAKTLVIIDTTDDSVSTLEIPSSVTAWRIYGKDKYYGDTVAVGDKIICAPLGNIETGIGVYDPATNVFTKKDIPSWITADSSTDLSGACADDDGDTVYFAWTTPVIYNVATDTFTEITVDAPAMDDAYDGCAVYGDKVYFTPSKADFIAVYDKVTEEMTYIDISDTPGFIKDAEGSDRNYGSPALSPEGKIFLVPRAQDALGILEP